MARAVIIEGGVVTNVIEVNEASYVKGADGKSYVDMLAPAIVVESETAQKNDSWDGQNFGPPQYDLPTLIEMFDKAVTDKLDSVARDYGYTNALHMASYAGYVPEEDTGDAYKYYLQGRAFCEWRSAVWAYCYMVQNEVQQGLRPVPQMGAFVKSLPIINLPEP